MAAVFSTYCASISWPFLIPIKWLSENEEFPLSSEKQVFYSDF